MGYYPVARLEGSVYTLELRADGVREDVDGTPILDDSGVGVFMTISPPVTSVGKENFFDAWFLCLENGFTDGLVTSTASIYFGYVDYVRRELIEELRESATYAHAALEALERGDYFTYRDKT